MFQHNMFDSHNFLLDMTRKTPENELDLIRDDEFETKSGTDIMEAPSGDDQERPKKKQYHRHTQHQIQELES